MQSSGRPRLAPFPRHWGFLSAHHCHCILPQMYFILYLSCLGLGNASTFTFVWEHLCLTFIHPWAFCMDSHSLS